MFVSFSLYRTQRDQPLSLSLKEQMIYNLKNKLNK